VVVVDCVVVVSVCAAAMDEMAAMAVAAPRARNFNAMVGPPSYELEDNEQIGSRVHACRQAVSGSRQAAQYPAFKARSG
jgi:hypothetical protein